MHKPSYVRTLAFFLLLAGGIWSCNRPVAQFTYEASGLQAPAEVRFQNQSEKAEQYQWYFGDGDTSGLAEPAHRFRNSGTYVVRLEAIQGKKSRTEEKEITIAPPEKTLVELQTRFGNMLVELYDETPEHRDNFYKLAGEGFFDSLLFHRVIEGFMIQGGDPNSRGAAPNMMLGAGGPGYTLPAEFSDSLIHIKGALAAARQGDAVNPEKRSSGSQFYIVQGRPLSAVELRMYESRTGQTYTEAQRQAYLEAGGTPALDGSYTVFGKVIEGLDVIDKIAAVPTDARDRPVENVLIRMYAIH